MTPPSPGQATLLYFTLLCFALLYPTLTPNKAQANFSSPLGFAFCGCAWGCPWAPNSPCSTPQRHTTTHAPGPTKQPPMPGTPRVHHSSQSPKYSPPLEPRGGCTGVWWMLVILELAQAKHPNFGTGIFGAIWLFMCHGRKKHCA